MPGATPLLMLCTWVRLAVAARIGPQRRCFCGHDCDACCIPQSQAETVQGWSDQNVALHITPASQVKPLVRALKQQPPLMMLHICVTAGGTKNAMARAGCHFGVRSEHADLRHSVGLPRDPGKRLSSSVQSLRVAIPLASR